jgi:hypothetical protein
MAERIVLPQPPTNCQSLSTVLQKMTAPPFSADQVASRSADFERAVQCLTEEQQASAYGHDADVTPQNEQAFKAFLQRQARASSE